MTRAPDRITWLMKLPLRQEGRSSPIRLFEHPDLPVGFADRKKQMARSKIISVTGGVRRKRGGVNAVTRNDWRRLCPSSDRVGAPTCCSRPFGWIQS